MMTAVEDDLPEFFKVYIEEHSSEQLEIPRMFKGFMGLGRSGRAELTGPGREKWPVELVQIGEYLYFRDGWEVFVKDNMVKAGEFLFFRYFGDLKFGVEIYDESMCQKRVEFCVNRGRGISDVVESQEENCAAGESQREGPQTCTSITPSFVVHVKKYNLFRGHHIKIPGPFVRENSLTYKSYEKMVLRTDKSSWAVNIIKTQSGEYYLCAGWTAFARDNNIKVGNRCKFELFNRLEMTVQVMNHRKNV